MPPCGTPCTGPEEPVEGREEGGGLWGEGILKSLKIKWQPWQHILYRMLICLAAENQTILIRLKVQAEKMKMAINF